MDFIPLIILRKRKIIGNSSKKLDEFKRIYILDLDGIEKGRPNFDIYQDLPTTIDLWVDNGPRNVGDVFDSLLAGATDSTIRKNFYKNFKFSDIREITENKIFETINFEKKDADINDFDGLVNFVDRKTIEENKDCYDYLNDLKMKNKIYTCESNPKNLLFWEELGIKGLLVEVDKFMEFKNAE